MKNSIEYSNEKIIVFGGGSFYAEGSFKYSQIIQSLMCIRTQRAGKTRSHFEAERE